MCQMVGRRVFNDNQQSLSPPRSLEILDASPTTRSTSTHIRKLVPTSPSGRLASRFSGSWLGKPRRWTGQHASRSSQPKDHEREHPSLVEHLSRTCPDYDANAASPFLLQDMNDEPASSAAASSSRVANELPTDDTFQNGAPTAAQIEERRKRNREMFNKKRGQLLDDLLYNLDILVYAQLSAIYYME